MMQQVRTPFFVARLVFLEHFALFASAEAANLLPAAETPSRPEQRFVAQQNVKTGHFLGCFADFHECWRAATSGTFQRGAHAEVRRLGKIRAGFPEGFAQFRQPNLCDGSAWLSASRGKCGFRVFALSSFRDYIPGRTTKTRRSEIAKDLARQPPGTSPPLPQGDSRVGLSHRIAKHRRCSREGAGVPHAILYTIVHFPATAKIEGSGSV